MADRCPVCGDEIRNGRCSFCGYRPTENDARAAERYAAQKAAFGKGPADPGGRVPRKKPVVKSGRAEPTAARKKPAAAEPRHAATGKKSPSKPWEAEKKAPPAKSRDKPGAARPPLAKRLLFKFVVFAWIALYLWLILGKVADDAAKKAQGPPATEYGQDGAISDGLPEIGSGGPEGGNQ